MAYVTAGVLAVPTENKDIYLKQARLMAELFRKHGALSVAEYWGDELPPGKKTSFPLAVQCREDETVVLSWVIWPSKDARAQGMPAAMAEAQQSGQFRMDIFDGTRTIFGGFEGLLED